MAYGVVSATALLSAGLSPSERDGQHSLCRVDYGRAQRDLSRSTASGVVAARPCASRSDRLPRRNRRCPIACRARATFCRVVPSRRCAVPAHSSGFGCAGGPESDRRRSATRVRPATCAGVCGRAVRCGGRRLGADRNLQPDDCWSHTARGDRVVNRRRVFRDGRSRHRVRKYRGSATGARDGRASAGRHDLAAPLGPTLAARLPTKVVVFWLALAVVAASAVLIVR